MNISNRKTVDNVYLHDFSNIFVSCFFNCAAILYNVSGNIIDSDGDKYIVFIMARFKLSSLEL